jgi:hypothetical protein
MKKILKLSALLGMLSVSACVGTDYIDDPIVPERLSIFPRINNLPAFQEQIFSVKYTDQYGIEAPAEAIVWTSSAPDKVSIDANGKAKTIAPGKATLYASKGNLQDSIVLNQSGGSGNPGTNDTTFFKKGVFMTVNTHYFAKGGVFLQTVNGITQVRTAADFGTSAGPSVYVLLTNHLNGSYSVTPGSNVINGSSAQITANKLSAFSGVQSWTVPVGVNPANYKYVVLYCVLGPIFGAAELKQ